MIKIEENLAHKYKNHIFPLFWQHGEDKNALCHYIEKIHNSGIKAVCIEARPHLEFAGEKWWSDMDAIIKECKERNMKIWILDDSHFPTGFCNGQIRDQYPYLRKRFLKLWQLDFIGPMKNAQAIIKYAFSDKEDQLIGAVLSKKISHTEVDAESLTDVTEGVKDNKTVVFDLPEGQWRLMVLVSTFTGGEKETEYYLNPIDPESTDVLIRTVYESHYEKYKEEFGKTILGFFSDEPRFGNLHGFHGSIGRTDMVLPWRKDMPALMEEKLGFSSLLYLPLLFVDAGKKAHEIRYAYMDLVSGLYSEHFNGRIAEWCKEHKVEYIGHTIEDNNAHARLGYGAGHFYRAMAHQDMAGIDVVLHQLLPGQDQGYFKSVTAGGWDGEFFHYALGKLGTSLGHLDPKKKGRTMCEVYGAYGWAEGIRLMKWITDHMLVRGVNEFVPHAFNPKEYPDADCPPHFYAHGRNPQYPAFKLLMDYTNRMSHLLSGGIHRAPIALVYHGEAEWSGDYMLLQKPAAELTRNQIDFDILPIDILLKSAVWQGVLEVNREIFKAVVVPYAEALPKVFLEKLLQFAEEGLPVFVLQGLPARASAGEDISELQKACMNQDNVHTLDLNRLVPELKKAGLNEIEISAYEPYLRYYHYEQEDGHIFMFVNEHPYNGISTKITIPRTENCYVYNAMDNKTEAADYMKEELISRFNLALSPYEAKVIVFSEKIRPPKREELSLTEVKKVSGPFLVSFAKALDYPAFSGEITLTDLLSLQQVEGKEDFTGIIRYETSFDNPDNTEKTVLKLSGVYETAKVYVNDSLSGIKICPPYMYDISDKVRTGKNKLVIEVTTTLAREQYDWLSQFMLLEPTGITGSIEIESYK